MFSKQTKKCMTPKTRYRTNKSQFTEFRHTLAFKLTFWYGVIFTLSSLLAFTIFYLTAVTSIYGRVDDELTEEMVDFAEILKQEGLHAVVREIEDERISEDPEKLFIRLMRSDQTRINSTDISSWNPLPSPHNSIVDLNPEPDSDPDPHDHENPKNDPPISITTHTFVDKPYPVRIACNAIGNGFIIQTGILLENETEMIRILRRIFYMVMTAVFFIAALAGWFMARRALSGIDEIRHTAWRITRGDMTHRVPPKKRGTEIEELAVMFNRMLDHINILIRKMREMTDNIAHDLKSPVTRIRGIAEVTLTTGNSEKSIEEYKIMAANTIEECGDLLELIDTMLDISETETGTSVIDFQEINIAELVRDVCEFFEAVAEQENISLNIQAPHSLWLNGDRRRLQRVIANLLDNALKYTPRNGRIEVVLLEKKRDEVTLQVNDTGVGMAKGDLPYIFDRFYRCDQSRSKPGNGLGLSLVKAIINAHKGTIHVSSRPGQGSLFEIKLPGLTLDQLCSTFNFPQNHAGSLL